MTKNTKNNFADNIKMFMNPEYITNVMKKIPAPDFTHATESAKRHGKTVESTVKIASDNFQTLMRKYAEIAQNQVNASLELIQNVTSSNNPEEAAAHQQEFIKNSVEQAINHTKEVIDLSSKSAMEMFNNVGSKVTEDINSAFAGCCDNDPLKK